MKTVAKELGIPAWQLYDWRKLYGPRPGGGGPAPQTLEEAEKEIGRLRSELIRMREREEALKKSLGILSEPVSYTHLSTNPQPIMAKALGDVGKPSAVIENPTQRLQPLGP